ncbi:MAG: methyltransferase [Nocardioidaceae bacterium]|nr:methyltransferase [Nocardioidaceae bacterium]
MRFGPLTIGFDERVLTPRPWTVRQSEWGAWLLDELPPGPVLELCCGAGQIGLLATYGSDRALVQVDRSEAACAWAAENAARAGRETDVRKASLEDALEADERFALVLADPPWVPHDAIARYPEDPPEAIDGGEDGLDLARQCVGVVARHLLPGGRAILQLGTEAQLVALRPAVREAGLRVVAQQVVAPRGGVLLQLGS